MANDRDIKKEYDESYDQAISDWQSYLAEAYKDLSYMVGNQWSSQDKMYLQREGRAAYVFNNIKRMIKQISGYQRRNRMSSICDPIEGGDQLVSDIFSDLLLYVLQEQGGYNILSTAFEGAVVTGLNLMSLWMDYGQDRANGDIKIGVEPFNSFLLDPMFTKTDLSDCRYIMRRRYISRDEAKLMLPGHNSDIDAMHISEGAADSKFNYMAYARTGGQKLMRYDEFWKRISKKATLLIDKTSGQTQIWRGTHEALRLFKDQFPWIESKTIYEPSVQLNIFLEDEVMYSGPDPYKLNDYPFVPVIGYYYPEYDMFDYKLQGVVRSMRDTQEELNKMKSKTSDILNSQVNSGWLVREGAVNNPEDLYRTGQGVVIERNSDSQPGDVNKLPAPEVSQSLFALVSSLQSDILQLAGGSEELLGVAQGGNTEVSGTLAKQRAYNSITTLQDLYDNLNLSQKILSKKIIRLIQNNWSTDKIAMITDKQVPQEINQIDVTKYDVAVREAMLTDTQRNLHYMQLIEAKRVGIAIPDSAIIKAMPISNKTSLLQEFEQEAQQQQAQAGKIQEQEEIARRLANAETIHKLSLAEQQRKRAVADQALAVERLSQVSQNKASAFLDMVKGYTELQGMRQDQIMDAITFLQNFQLQKNNDMSTIVGLSQMSNAQVEGQSEEAGKSEQQKQQDQMQEQQIAQLLQQASQQAVLRQ